MSSLTVCPPQVPAASEPCAQCLEPHLDQMVDHKGADAGSPPLRMHQQEGDVGLVVLHVWHHETKANHDFLIEDHHAEVRVLQTL